MEIGKASFTKVKCMQICLKKLIAKNVYKCLLGQEIIFILCFKIYFLYRLYIFVYFCAAINFSGPQAQSVRGVILVYLSHFLKLMAL